MKIGIPTASMPDIIFQLLIFFMVSTVLREFQGLKVSLPEASKIEKLPLVEIGNSLRNTVQGAERLVNSAELRNAVKGLNQTLQNTRKFTANLDATLTPELNEAIVRLNEAIEKVTPEINATLDQTQKTLADIGGVVSPDSPIYSELRRALKELADAAKSIRVMADYLERHPDALIYGKGKR